jgi:hypothetical protein
LDQLDSAFGPRAGRTQPIEGCLHCFTPSALDVLSGPVDCIDGADLVRALSKWGGTLDASVAWMRWVAPRLLRGVVEGTQADGELVAARLHAAGWAEWPDPEHQAVEALCVAWWRAVLSGGIDGASAVTALSFLVPLTGAVVPWLEIWSATPGRFADQQAGELWREWGYPVLDDELRVAIYAEGPNIAPDLAAWFRRGGARRALAAGGLDELSAWSLAQLPLPAEERWR